MSGVSDAWVSPSPDDRRARSRCGVMLQESGVNGALHVRELVELFRAYYPSPMPTADALAADGFTADGRTVADTVAQFNEETDSALAGGIQLGPAAPPTLNFEP